MKENLITSWPLHAKRLSREEPCGIEETAAKKRREGERKIEDGAIERQLLSPT